MKEYVKDVRELTSTPEFLGEFLARMQADIAEANKGVSHADFVAGVLSGTMGFKCVRGEPSQFL